MRRMPHIICQRHDERARQSLAWVIAQKRLANAECHRPQRPATRRGEVDDETLLTQYSEQVVGRAAGQPHRAGQRRGC